MIILSIKPQYMKKLLTCFIMTFFFLKTFAYRLEYGSNVTINQPVYENLYIAGGSVTINAPVYGDLVCAGGTVSINDSVMNDILVAGGNVVFNGYAGGDIRCAGGQLYLQKNTSGDLVVAGGQVTVNRDVIIGGGLMAGGGDISFNGVVKKTVKVAAGQLSFNGIAEQDVDMRCGSIEINGSVSGKTVIAAPTIRIGNNASFNNDVRYWNKKGALDFKVSIKRGQAVYDPSLEIKTGRWYYLGGVTVLALLWHLGTAFLLIALIQYLFSSTMKKSGDTVFHTPLKSFGIGLLVLVAVPIAAIIAFVTVIGVPVGLLLLFNYVVLIVLAATLSSVVAANWINNRFNYKWSYWRLVFAALGAFILIKLFSFTPFLGWFIMLLIVCLSFGAIFINIRWRREKPVIPASAPPAT
jgi:hypothetical protein